jgi:hypothetical protein
MASDTMAVSPLLPGRSQTLIRSLWMSYHRHFLYRSPLLHSPVVMVAAAVRVDRGQAALVMVRDDAEKA